MNLDAVKCARSQFVNAGIVASLPLNQSTEWVTWRLFAKNIMTVRLNKTKVTQSGFVMQRDSVVCGDCVELMEGIPDESVDLVVTSPPYWNQRSYSHWDSYEKYISDVAVWVRGVYRVLKSGRHCFWVIPDKLPYPPKENGTKERLYMPIYSDTERIASECGFVCEFPIIWLKYQAAQRMFGSYPYPPNIIHTPMTERICVWRKQGKADLSSKSKESLISLDDWKEISKDIWQFRSVDKKIHPAQYPEEIPNRVIKCWSFVGDTVLDPFCGSGTTLVAAQRQNRKYIGFDISPDYVDLAISRLEKVPLD